MKIRILQGVLVLILSACAIFLGVAVQQAVYHWEEEVPQEQPDLGGVNSVAGIRYFLHGSGVSATDSSITLTSFKQPVNQYPLSMTDFGDIAYLTLEPGNTTRQEFISFTGVTQNSDGTATLTGVTRGLSFVSPYTASSTIRKAHPGGSDAVISNPPQFYERFLNTFNNATSSGVHVWGSTTPPRYDLDPAAHRAGTFTATTSEFASVRFVIATGAGANVSASETVRGEVELATQLEMSSSTATGGTGASLILQSRYATSSPSAVCGRCTPITGNNGKLSQLFFDLTQAFTWTAHHIFSSAFFTNSSSTNATTTNLYISGTPSGNIANTASTSVWTADGTWTKPHNAKSVFIQLWGGGGSGGVGQQAGTGGGGGEYREWWIPASELASTVTVTIGTGGTAVSTAGNSNGNTGGNTTFGSHLIANGGGAGQGSASGADLAGGGGGRPFSPSASFWGTSETTDLLKDGIYSAAAGFYDHTINVFAGGSSYWGGAGGGTGGGSPASSSAGGTSTHGGNGGAGATGAGPTATSGSAPGGGGGGTRISSGTGTSGAGGAGRAKITTIF